MGFIDASVRALSVLSGPTTSFSSIVDLGASTTVSARVEVSTVSADTLLRVDAQHSIDRITWADLSGLSFAHNGPATETKRATENAFRYCRFKYSLFGADAIVTFGVRLFVVDRYRPVELS